MIVVGLPFREALHRSERSLTQPSCLAPLVLEVCAAKLAEDARELAHREFRRPRDQASVLLIEAVRRAVSETPAVDAGTPDPSVEPSVPMG